MTNEEKNEIKARLELDKMNYWDFLLSGAKETPLTAEQLKDAQEKMAERIYALANVNGLSSKSLAPITDGVCDFEAYLSSKPKIMWILKEPYDEFTAGGKAKGGDYAIADLAPITDGVCDFEAYLSSKPKIMWILKEPYDEFTKSGKPKGGDYSISDAIKNADLKNTSTTWKRMAQITHNILTGESTSISDFSEEEIRTALSRIAYINVSKMPASKTSSSSDLSQKYELWRETLLMQIDLYSPDIIIFGYTFGLFSDDLGVTGDFDYKDKDGWTNIYKKGSRLLVDTYHPDNTQPYEYFDYPTAVVKSIQKMWKNGMENLHLKSIDIHGFKSFANPTHIDFSAGINAVFAPATNGAEDLLSAIQWLFGLCDESEISAADKTEVKAVIVTENDEEVEIVRRASKESVKINSNESSVKAISQFQKYLNIESDTSLAFGKTKIIVTDDKKLAAKANRLIGVTIAEDGTAKIYTIAIAQEDFERL